MAENKMKEVAQLLGIKLGEKFNIKGFLYNPYHFDKSGLIDNKASEHNDILVGLLTGCYKIEEPILDKVEKCYLEKVLKPFKNKIIFIKKQSNYREQYILISIKKYDESGEEIIDFPYFKKNSMYKGMKPNKKYSLKELGLFEDE